MSIHQPAYLPWLGLFDRIAKSDIFIILDCVQFEKGSYINRVKIRNHSEKGWQWLTIPVSHEGLLVRPISGVQIANAGSWTETHCRAIQTEYGKAPFFHMSEGVLEALSQSGGQRRLMDALDPTFLWLSNALGIKATPAFLASSLNPQGRKVALVLELCKKVGAKKYLSGPLGRNYLDIGLFEGEGIEVEFHDFKHPVYPQMHGGPFIPGLSAIDWLFNTGMPWDPNRPWEKVTAHAF